MALMGMHRSAVMHTPMVPDANPMITVSAVNMLETLRFEAPMDRSTPISLVRSCTEIRVITPIMMEDTTSDIATNAIST